MKIIKSSLFCISVTLTLMCSGLPLHNSYNQSQFNNPWISAIEDNPEPTMYSAQHSDPFDFCLCSIYSLAFIALSFKVHDSDVRSFLRTTGIMMPAARFLSTRKIYNSLLKQIPIVRNHLTCPDENCTSICNKCKIKQLYKEAPILCSLSLASTLIYKKFQKLLY